MDINRSKEEYSIMFPLVTLKDTYCVIILPSLCHIEPCKILLNFLHLRAGGERRKKIKKEQKLTDSIMH
jgi:hypothetical protein